MTPGQAEALALHNAGVTQRVAAEKLGISRSAYRERIRGAQKYESMPEGQQAALSATGLDAGIAKFGWRIVQQSDGSKDSVFWKSESGETNLVDAMRDAISELRDDDYPVRPERAKPTGECLLVIDLADVHIGKLCVETETGTTYSRDIAVHRMVEGTRGLLRKSEGHGIGRILFVLGNDILHVDNSKGTTTSGTPQDTDGSYFQMYRDAVAAYVRTIEMCADVAPVDLIYCPSNHDWLSGWTLAQTVGVWFQNDKRVSASEYNLSELHRKYFRFSDNIIGLTHGDGAKEADLYPLMVTEARAHISDCAHRYWYVHHFHHKNRKAQGVLSHKREKDHIGMTMLHSNVKAMEGDNIQIEYVRSPSAPDGWHHRNGFVNRQAVECFIHHPSDGQNARFTEWF
jgi:hypothetical protein